MAEAKRPTMVTRPRRSPRQPAPPPLTPFPEGGMLGPGGRAEMAAAPRPRPPYSPVRTRETDQLEGVSRETTAEADESRVPQADLAVGRIAGRLADTIVVLLDVWETAMGAEPPNEFYEATRDGLRGAIECLQQVRRAGWVKSQER